MPHKGGFRGRSLSSSPHPHKGHILRQLYQRIAILDRYFLWQYLWPCILAVGAFGLIGVVDVIFYLIELSVLSGISAIVVIQLILYKLPAILILFFPIAVLFSIMLLLVRMIKDNELLVLLSSGVSTVRIIAPLIVLGVLTSLMTYFANESLVPWTNQKANALIAKEIDRKPPPEIAENIVFKGTEDRFFYVQQIDRKTGVMKSVLIFEDSATLPRILVADRAQWGINTWTLWQGRMFEFDNDANLSYTNTFDQMKIHVNQNLDMLDSSAKSPTEMDSKELKMRINSLSQSGLSTQSLKVEYGLKQAIPIACGVFAIIGIAYCFTFIKTGKDWWGVVISIGVAAGTVMLYFFVLAVTRALGKGGTLSPFWAAWTANILFGLVGSGIIVHQSRRR
jgi:lipopolysaccharide export system permease protein